MAQKRLSNKIINAARSILESQQEDNEQPFYIFDAESAREKARYLKLCAEKTFRNVELAFSIKSCGLTSFCQDLMNEGFSAEVCSLEEIYLAQHAGFSFDKIIFDGPFKLTKELEYAVNHEIRIHVDSSEELYRLFTISQEKEKKIPIIIRLSHFYSPGERSRFGLTLEEFLEIKHLLINRKGDTGLTLSGFHFHVGSNMSRPDRICETLTDFAPFLCEYMPENGYLNMGSGIPADSFCADYSIKTPSADEFFNAINGTINTVFDTKALSWKFLFEPGRCISEDHGYICGRTFGTKRRYNSQVLQTNLGINWLPSVRNWHHRLFPLDYVKVRSIKDSQLLSGFNCFECDSLMPEKDFPELSEGEYFLIKGCGAYDLQTATEWTRRKPAVWEIRDGRTSVVRPRQKINFLALKDIKPENEIIRVSENICLRQTEDLYSSKLFEIIAKNREYYSKYMSWPRYVFKKADTSNFLTSCRLLHQKGEGKYYVILYEGEPAGMLSFNNIDNANKTAYIGYWLDLDLQRKGIVSASLLTLIKYWGERGEIKRFVIKCVTTNTASNFVAAKCKFHHEGILRQSEIINGTYYDQNIYSYIYDHITKN